MMEGAYFRVSALRGVGVSVDYKDEDDDDDDDEGGIDIYVT